ncbi:MAG: 16S rRNA (cytosine(967)-C(5))-methyltransferase RsmB [Lachnospiraceae bacterium]|nr:16S rRNA (cytosine(967)-C(5))-methyltransferase RsmB [Lachnospiraceae bacterium]
MSQTRELALDILVDIDKKKSFSHLALSDTLRNYQFMEKQDRAFLTRICQGTLENQIQIDYIINQFSKVKITKCKPVIRAILRMGVYQLKYMDHVPNSAVCNEAVKLAKKRGFYNLAGFVNGVLRNIARNIDQIVYPDEKKEPIKSLSIQYSMPEWLISEWLKEYDIETIKKILQSFLKVSPTTIRVQRQNASITEVKDSLQKEQIRVLPGNFMPEALQISGYDYLEDLKPFQEGKIVVQDESSMLVGQLADPKEGMLVLDVCSAPGGKALHIADKLHGTGSVISRDLTEYKVDLIEENRERLQCNNLSVQVFDALDEDQDLIGKVDLVIADLPCSGLGIIGKKHDIKYNVTKEKIEDLVILQRQILAVVTKYLKQDGVLMYSTCTISKKENIRNVQWMIDHLGLELIGFDELMPESLFIETAKDGYIQLLPGIHPCDGFFIAKLRRKR